jgi:hypothetical protein
MSDRIIDALRAKLSSGEAKPKRGVLRRWMRRNYNSARSLFAEGLSWEDFIAELDRQGVRNDHGKKVSVRRAQQTWGLVRKEMEARESTGRTEPRPRFDPPPVIPASPGPSQNSDVESRREYREDLAPKPGVDPLAALRSEINKRSGRDD